MEQRKIIIIAGPTASGKSAFGLDLALKNQGTLINADAMQVYEGLPILSAQPTAEEKNRVPHELYGTLDPKQKSSAGNWLLLAKDAINRTFQAGRVPIIVGGTGLYCKALLGGLAEIPEIPKNVRAEVQKLYDDLGEENFRCELTKLDPKSAKRLAKNDRQRSIRAYEVAKHTGQPLSHWHSKSEPRFLEEFEIEKHLLMPPRDRLYAACDQRLRSMIEHGAIEEVKNFMPRNIDPELPAMKTLGLREFQRYLNDQNTLEEAIAEAQQATRNYAKRQMTWFRNQWSEIN